MPPQKIITINFSANHDGALIHKVYNFGEDLWREIEQAGLGDVGGLDTIDKGTDTLRIQVRRTQKIATVRKLVQQLLAAHFLDSCSEVSYS